MIKFKKKNSNIKISVKNSSSNLSQNKESSSYLNNINQKSKIKQRKKNIHENNNFIKMDESPKLINYEEKQLMKIFLTIKRNNRRSS